MAASILFISLLILGFYYGALFLSLAPRFHEWLIKWFSSGEPYKGKSLDRRHASLISNVSSLDITKISPVHWVIRGNHGNQSTASAKTFSLKPLNGPMWNPPLSVN